MYFVLTIFVLAKLYVAFQGQGKRDLFDNWKHKPVSRKD